MTGRTQTSMSDARLDRLIAQELDNRGEDVASVALPAREMAERLAVALRPAYLRPLPVSQMPLALVLLLVVGLLLAAVVAASLVGSRPTVVTPAISTFECGPLAPGGPDASEITVVDETGSATGCRAITIPSAELGSLGGGVDIVFRAGGKWLDVVWLVAGCDGPARVEVGGEAPSHLEIAVIQTRTEPCGPGMGVRSIRLEFPMPIHREALSGSLTHSSDAP